jgi:hypothetical protein
MEQVKSRFTLIFSSQSYLKHYILLNVIQTSTLSIVFPRGLFFINILVIVRGNYQRTLLKILPPLSYGWSLITIVNDNIGFQSAPTITD